MKILRPSLALFLIFCPLLSTASLAQQILPSALDGNGVTQYLSQQSKGFIQVKPGKSAELNQLHFEIDYKRSSFRSAHFIDPQQIIDLYQFDVDGFLAANQQTDFLEAKIKFYSSLHFNPKTQRYTLPYLRPSEWRGLFFHPCKACPWILLAATAAWFLATFAQKVQEGIEVKVMSEGLWANVLARGCADKLRDAGVDVIASGDLSRFGNQHSYFHNKIWIFDGEEAIIGGQNMVNSDNESTGFNGRNRDVDLWVKGPAGFEPRPNPAQLLILFPTGSTAHGASFPINFTNLRISTMCVE